MVVVTVSFGRGMPVIVMAMIVVAMGRSCVAVVIMTVIGSGCMPVIVVAVVVMTVTRVVAVPPAMTVIVVRLVLVAHSESIPQPLSAVFAAKSV
jgi:hypothetical protein